jgi:F-type H+-transporting ATPase subunit delta
VRDRNVATRYAEALLVAAQHAGVVEPLAESYLVLVEQMEANRDLQVFLHAPQIPEREKKALMERVLGGRVEPLLLTFFDLLLDKGRIVHARDIQQEFAKLVEESQGVQRAVVTTAVPLPEDLAVRLQTNLAKMTGKTIILEQKTDPAVIGGVSVTLGDEILDGTVRTGLDRMRHQLEQAALR